MKMETYICSVTRADDQTPVEHEFHIARSARLRSGGGDVLADVAGRNDNLRLANIVILDEYTLQQVTNLLVVVDNLPDAVDQVNDGLGHPVAGSSLATKYRNTRGDLLALLW